jgi:Integrin alpha
VLGSTQNIVIQYEIANAGESAYLTQLKVSIPTNITQFSRVPPTCKEESNRREMVCEINQGRPVVKGETVKLDISLDATKLDGESFKVISSVTSSGDEKRPADNEYVNEIIMTEFSDIEFTGQSSETQLSLENGLKVHKIQYSYKVYNNGPSTIKELNLALKVPLNYIPRPNFYIPVTEFNVMNITGFYLNKVYEVTWFKHNEILLQSSEDLSANVPVVENMNTNFDSSKLGFDYEFNAPGNNEQQFADTNHRRRRSIWQNDDDENIYRVYNQYTASIDEYHPSYHVSNVNEDQTLRNLPKNRTIYFDCSTSLDTNECVEAQFTIHNFRPGSEPISIVLDFTIDLNKIGEILEVFLVDILF